LYASTHTTYPAILLKCTDIAPQIPHRIKLSKV